MWSPELEVRGGLGMGGVVWKAVGDKHIKSFESYRYEKVVSIKSS